MDGLRNNSSSGPGSSGNIRPSRRQRSRPGSGAAADIAPTTGSAAGSATGSESGAAGDAAKAADTRSVKVIKVNLVENYEDDTNQTGQSEYEMKMQDRYFSTPNRKRSEAYHKAVDADRAKKDERRARKVEKKGNKEKRVGRKKNPPPPQLHELAPNTVPWAIENTKRVGILNLSKMDLDRFPEEVFDSMPGTARIINLSFNRLVELDPRICDYVLVQRLIASCNFLSSVPPSLGRMTALKKLDLARNKLTALPDVFSGMRLLEVVDLSGNMLTELPDSFSTLQLTALNLSRNQFSIAPLQLDTMEWLMELDLSENQLTAVPETWISLARLITLNLDSNKISDFPNVMLQLCADLLTLRLHENPIKMSVLEAKDAFPAFNERRRNKLRRQITAGAITEADLCPAD